MTERKQKIYDRLRHDYKYVSDQGYEVFGIFLQGSQNYNLDYEGSDIDTKCIVLPSAKDIILNKQPVSKTLILEDNSHIDLKDIRLMWNCFKKQNINYLEILFTDFFYLPDDYYDYWLEITEHREEIAHYDNYAAVSCIVGMILEKNAALCHPYPSLKHKIDKYGYDNKQLHHIIRCEEFLKRYIAGVPFKDCLIPADPEYLISVKAEYIYDLENAKGLAASTVESVKSIKQEYLKANLRTIQESVNIHLDNILVAILKTYWIGKGVTNED
jgi:predicted nucleotidyltransferase